MSPGWTLGPSAWSRPSKTQPGLVAVLMAVLIPLPFPQTSPRPDGRAWRELLVGFQARGVAVIMAHPRCREPDLEGLYVRGRREVVVCPRGEPSATLRHEGWHLVQSLCLAGNNWLDQSSVQARLSLGERRELDRLVAPGRRPREAKARVMAKLPPETYLQAMDQACAGRLPFVGLTGIRGRSALPP